MRRWISRIRIATGPSELPAPSTRRPVLSPTPSPVSGLQTSAAHPIHPRRYKTNARSSPEAWNQGGGGADRSYEPAVPSHLVCRAGGCLWLAHRCPWSAGPPGHISSASSKKGRTPTSSGSACLRQPGAGSRQRGSEPAVDRSPSGRLPVGTPPGRMKLGVQVTILQVASADSLKGG